MSDADSLGEVVAIHVADAKRAVMQARGEIVVVANRQGDDGTAIGGGIEGDRYFGTRHRHVSVQTLEELNDASERLGRPIDPGLTRRNITLASGRLERTPGTRLRIGTALLEVVRDAAPCKRMDEELGNDARLALHMRAGVICRVLEGGTITHGAVAKTTTLA